MTDNELKLKLAKMLADKIVIASNNTTWWKASIVENPCINQNQVKDTELLHCCHFVEQGLTDEQHYLFRSALWNDTELTSKEYLDGECHSRKFISPTWQKRVVALQPIVNKKV